MADASFAELQSKLRQFWPSVTLRAVAGRIGRTAIGNTLEEARGRYYAVKAAVDEAAASA